MNWPRTHWWVGTVTLVLFVLSGAYMRWVAHVPDLEDLTRALFRSRHLFLMLSALVNLALSANPPPVRRLHRVIATLALVAPIFLLMAFWREPAQGIEAGPWSQVGLYLSFAAAALLVIDRRTR